MSRIGKKAISVPPGVKVELAGPQIKVSGAAGNLKMNIRPEISVNYDKEKSQIVVTRQSDTRQDRALHGTTRALIANMVQGVVKGYEKQMKIFGTGYNVKTQGKDLVLALGFAKPAVMPIPEGVKVDIKTPATRGNEVPAEFAVQGADKWSVGQFAAELRRLRPPEPYKGKGVRYADEIIKKKVGKAFGSTA
jgi:large subunit ribosomal protein L6